jgi:hypothetical protein
MHSYQTITRSPTNTPLIQTQLKIGKPGDKFEREADAMADRVMAMPKNEFSIQRKCSSCEKEELQMKSLQGSNIQMQPLEEEEELLQPKLRLQPMEEEEEMLQTKVANGNATTSESISKTINLSKEKGSGLQTKSNQFMSNALGANFSSVRVHTGQNAAKMNQSLNARAFTYGNNIYFNKGEYNPESSMGKRLLAHELTHVVQQNSRGNTKMISREPNPSNSSDLPTKEREELKRITGNRLDRSASYYNDALLEVKIKVGNMLKEQKAAADAMFELAFGLLMPGLGKLLGRGLAGVATALPPNASTLAYRTAIALLDVNKTKEIFVKATDIGLKISKIDINNQLKSITGDSEYEMFFIALEKSAAIGFDKIDSELSNKSDIELGILYMGYNPAETSSSDYVKVIEDLFLKFKKQVKPIGKKTDGRYGSMKARWIEGSKWKALALTGEGRYFNVGAGTKFITWISPEMKESALKATEAINLGQVENVHYKTVQESSATTVANMKSLLDSDSSFTGGNIVLEPSTGNTKIPDYQACPSCHGETKRETKPNSKDLGFLEERLIFPPETPRISESELKVMQEWLLSISKE